MKNKEEQWEDPYPRKRSYRWLRTLILLVVVYLFSFGPMNALKARGRMSQSTLDTIYKPLNAASDAVPFIGSMLDWYARVWVSEAARSKKPN